MSYIRRDRFGAVGQAQSDGFIDHGDSACWNGHLEYNAGDSRPGISFFEVGFGAYVRHPEKLQTTHGFGAYYKNPWAGCMSRDQLTGVLCGLIRENNLGAKLRFIFNHACRGFLFAYNTIHNGKKPSGWKVPDLTLFDFWALELRMFGYFFWPLLCVFDFHTLLAVLLFNRNKNQSNDVINLAMKVIVCKEVAPTPLSRLAYGLLNKPKMRQLISNYWSEWRDNPGMVDSYNERL